MRKALFSKERFAALQKQEAQRNQLYMEQQLQTLTDVKQNLQDFKQQLQASSNPKLQKQLEVRIRHQEQQMTNILGRLKNAGYTDKRGRPKKEVTDTYKANRIKFTAHLQKEQMDYIKQLQATGQIANVSAFLDELIAQHQKNNG